MLAFLCFLTATLWAGAMCFAFSTNRIGQFQDKPLHALLAGLGVSLLVVGIASVWTSVVVLGAFVFAYIVRRPKSGLRGHLWAFSMTMFIPGAISFAVAGWQNMAAATQALNLIHLGLLIYMVDCYSAYRERNLASA